MSQPQFTSTHPATEDHGNHGAHPHAADHAQHEVGGGLNAMALSATLHCLTGCAIGEIMGLMVGTALGLSTGWTIALAVALAFLFGYTLSTFPLLRAGLGVGAALSVVLAADTLSIATMEVVDNLVMAVIPGAMDAGLVNVTFWVSMMLALAAAFLAAYPVNRYLLQRGKGHALTHGYHGGDAGATGARRFIPSLATSTLAAAIVAFMLGGLTVSLADDLGGKDDESVSHASAPAP
jgi:preprotein translocase subunit SecG